MFRRESWSGDAHLVDEYRQHYVLLIINGIILTVLILAFVRLYPYIDKLLFGLVIGSVLFLIINLTMYFLWKRLHTACVATSLLSLSFSTIFLAHGGVGQTAMFWVYPFPIVLMTLLGPRQGVLCCLLMIAIFYLILFGPNLGQTMYPEVFKIRFLVSISIVGLLAFVNEYFRERNHAQMDALQREKEQQANTDALTTLSNRRFIEQALKPHLEEQSELFLPLSILAVDIDHFKAINDTFGHSKGDVVLQQIASLFRHHIRQRDIACRYGGEEFLLFLPHTPLEDALTVAEKIRVQVSKQRFLTEHADLVITASIGVATITLSHQFELGIQLADQHLYEAKTHGRNQVRSKLSEF